MTLTEKFEPYWADTVGHRWTSFLGSLAGRDPVEFLEAEKLKWSDAHQFIIRLSIRGFLSGLTVFQACHSLVVLGLCKPPTASEMANWVARHRSLGAFAGLKLLGFRLTARSSRRQVRAAFLCVYLYLDHHLSPVHKTKLGFGAIFVEHLLCKVVRWSKRCNNMVKSPTLFKLRNLVEYAEQRYNKLRDDETFPIPRPSTADEFDEVFAREKVRPDSSQHEEKIVAELFVTVTLCDRGRH